LVTPFLLHDFFYYAFHVHYSNYLIGVSTILVLAERSLETLDKCTTHIDFYNPLVSGGRFLAFFDELTGLGEPFNVGLL